MSNIVPPKKRETQTSNISITPPWILLNDDVLREIFIRCIFRDPNTNSLSPKNLAKGFVVGSYKPSIREYPQLCVSKVCSSWRNIALLTPQLWDKIWIYGLTNANLYIAREYLSRARNWPVSIDICINESRDVTSQALHSLLIDFLSSFRLQDLSLQSHLLHLHLILPRLPERSVEDLESLHQVFAFADSLIHRGSEEAVMDLNVIRYPKLGLARIWGAYKISGFPNSLRTFDGAHLLTTVIECLDLLRCSPLLEGAQLRITGRHRPVSMPQINLRHLRELSLESSADDIAFSTFIETLSLPALEELWLDGQAVAWPAIAFQSLAHRSNYFPHLREFHLADSTSIIDAGTLLALMPSLKSISLLFSFVDSEVIFDRNTLIGLASGSLAPRLQSLTVGCISNTGLFLDMVEKMRGCLGMVFQHGLQKFCSRHLMRAIVTGSYICGGGGYQLNHGDHH